MLYICIISVLFVLELYIKNHIVKTKKLNEEVPIIEDELFIKYIQNKGATYGLFEDKPKVVCGVSVGILLAACIAFVNVLFKRGNNELKLGLSLVIAGGASNVYDRLKRKYVVDYIYWKKLKKIIFNLSDVFIVIGSVITLLSDLLNDK